MKPCDSITTDRLLIRHWDKQHDADAFFELNNDPRVMEFFPGRRTRSQANALLDLIEAKIRQQGFGWSAIELRKTGQVIGFGGIAHVEEGFPNGPSAEIGWRYLPEFWGKGYATEAAAASRDYGFEVLNLPEILSFAVPGNHASFAVMRRIGMVRFEHGDFDHPNVPVTFPLLKPHHCYRMDRDLWHKQKPAE